jgi:hypothetical protein
MLNCTCAETVCQLLRMYIHSVGVIDAVLEHTLVLRQVGHDRVQAAALQRHCADSYLLLLPTCIRDLPVSSGIQ